MNIIDLQERLKDLPETALMQEMQMPSGTAPQFLVLSELKRRKRMRDEYQRQQAQGMQTVAEEAITAAGMPQQGIMGLAQGMAPRSAIAQDTGVNDMVQQESVRAPQPEQPMMMADGGYVQRMQDGGRTEDSGFVQRLLEDIKRRIRAGRMSEEEAQFLLQNFSMLPEPLNPVSAGMDAVRLAEEGDYPGAAINAASVFPLGRIVGPAMNVAAELYNRAGDREIEPVSEFPVGMADGGYVQRMAPGGFTDRQQQGYLIFLQQMGLQDSPESQQAYMQMMERQRVDQISAPPQGLADVSADVSDFLPIMPGQDVAQNALSRLRPTQFVGVGADRPPAQIDFDAAAPPAPEPVAEQESDGVYTDQLRNYLASYRGDRGLSRPFETDPLDPRSPGFVPREDTVSVGDLEFGEVATPAESDFGLERVIEDLGLGPAVAAVRETQEAARERERAPEAAGQFEEEARAADRELLALDLQPVAGTFEQEALGADAEISALTSGTTPPPLADTDTDTDTDTGGGGAGGAGGAGDFGPIESRIARMLEEREKSAEADKWLSLAQTGLALMASDQPTLGGAIGEAGLAGIGALQKARSQYDKDIMSLLDMQAGVQRARASGARTREPKPRTAAELNAALDFFEGEVERLAKPIYGPDPSDPMGMTQTIVGYDYSSVPPDVMNDFISLRDQYKQMFQSPVDVTS